MCVWGGGGGAGHWYIQRTDRSTPFFAFDMVSGNITHSVGFGAQMISVVTDLWSDVNDKPITIIIHYVDVKIVL